MKDTLNPNEWIVMEALWAKSPATLGETIDRIGSRASWNYKTYQSYMNVLEKKGYISSEKRGRDKFYSTRASTVAFIFGFLLQHLFQHVHELQPVAA